MFVFADVGVCDIDDFEVTGTSLVGILMSRSSKMG